MDKKDAILVLKDGTVMKGKGIGKEGMTYGEIVFNTSMTGYEEAITDPSYKYQILLFTYPLIGNYGVNFENFESEKIQCNGIIVKESCEKFSHPFAKKSLNEFLKENNITGISNVDTRFLTRKIRNFGVMNGLIKFPHNEKEIDELKEKAKNLPDISELDLVREVTTKEVKFHYANEDKSKNKRKVVLIDCGEKRSIIRKILEKGIDVIQVPAFYDAEKILEFDPDGIIVSNGPGDPIKA
ncbi:MAG: carbamoyl phosphate synthase small subunit, partial [Candidatus Altarchaeaceae archaeon]